jgi:subtilisin
MDVELNRRRLLQFVGIGALGSVPARTAAAPGRTRHNVGTQSRRAERAARQAADAVHRELDFGDRGKVISGRFPQEALEALENRPDVRYVEPDDQYEAIGEALPWGVDRVDANVVHDAGETGGDDTDGEGGADVAIVDTGIDDDHPDLAGNLGDGVAYAACSGTDCTYDWSDDHGHGTHCAGIAGAVDNDRGTIGVAPGVTLHAVKVLAEDGRGYYSDIAAGIEWVADNGYDVASLSLGGTSSSYTLRDACQYADDNGVLVVAAAGNEGPCSDCVLYPARYDSAVAVSATDSGDDLASFSSTGPEIELAAPGEYIYSTVPDGYESWSGTSMACPHVSGAGAQLMDNGLSSAEARSALRDDAEDIGLGANAQGYGLLDVETSLDGTGETQLAVSTDAASSVGETTATLSGTLDSLGGASSASVGFEYRQAGTNTWSATSTQTRSSTGNFSESVDGLESGTDYEFRAVADGGDGDADTGTAATFTTATADTSVAVSTTGASGVDDTVATFEGSLDDLGGASSADVGFEYRESGTDAWTATATEGYSSTGAFSREVTGLTAGVTYEFRATATASDGDTDTGSTASITTDTDVVVSTDAATDVGESSATLEGTLSDLGDASSADVGFEYRESSATTWTATATETVSATGTVTRDVSGLSSGTEYEFRAVATASDGDVDAGSATTFTTTKADTAVAVSTTGSSGVGETSATLEGSLDDLGGASSAEVAFDYRPSGTSSWSTTAGQTRTSTGAFSADVSGLSSGTTYEFRAIATASDGDTDTGTTASFATNEATGDTAPAIDTYRVTEAGSPNPHAEITAEWAVSDADGDLSRVDVVVSDAGGEVDRRRTPVGGSSASGTTEFKIKHGGGVTYDVTLTVTDAAGNTASRTETVSSGGGKGGK